MPPLERLRLGGELLLLQGLAGLVPGRNDQCMLHRGDVRAIMGLTFGISCSPSLAIQRLP